LIGLAPSPMQALRRSWTLPRAALACAAITGCAAFEDNAAQVNMFATHHAAPVAGVIPNAGEDDQPRVFDNDEGWTITLVDAYIVTTGARLVRCDSSVFELDLFWGPCPEDLRGEDLELLSVAGLGVPPGEYCELQVDFGPYVRPELGPGADAPVHEIPESPQVEGASVYLRGLAERNGEQVAFEHRATDRVVVEFDLVADDPTGEPTTITTDEGFPKELTTSKTYDEFFLGVDFATYEPAAYDAELGELLVAITHAFEGTVEVAPD